MVKNLPANTGDVGSIIGPVPGLGGFPGGGNGNPSILAWKIPWTEEPGRTPWVTKELDITSVQFSSVAQLCPTLYNPMNCSTPGLPVYHQLPEFTQTYVH